MQNLIDLEEKIFFDCQNILENLSKITTKDELLLKQDLFYELTERIAFLKVLDKNKESLEADNKSINKVMDTEEIQVNEMLMEEETLTTLDENSELEEVIFNNELNEIHSEEADENFESTEDNNSFEAEQTHLSELEVEQLESTTSDEEDDAPIAELMKDEEVTEPETIQNFESQSIEIENRGKIIAYEKDNKPVAESKPVYLENEPKKQEEKKISLGQIKGMKIIESLFDDDPLERIVPENEKSKETKQLVPDKIAVANETLPKKPIEFRLDMNDKIAFSKYLFGGSQFEMNETISILNSFDNLEQAKEYLSDLYYDKHWDKVDDYAQRLWMLVENKFL
ncbi:MAG: hypothetical protein JSS94_04055 [Bacteroidetes bacterium]|nr:hypothetical protein [Bacteroidota bacterium]